MIVFNLSIYYKLQSKYSNLLALLPSIFLFLGIPSTLLFERFLVLLGERMGVYEGTAIKDQENGLIWVGIIIVCVLVLMFIGYIFGWFLNWLILTNTSKLTKQEVNLLFLESKPPENWLSNEAKIPNVICRNKNSRKKHSKIKIIVVDGGILWGGSTFIVFLFPLYFSLSDEITGLIILTNLFLWFSLGLLFGWVKWKLASKQ